MRVNFLVLFAWMLLPSFAVPSPKVVVEPRSRDSASYHILAEALDSGGNQASSVSYQHIGSAGLVSGISTAPQGNLAVKAGYIAQLQFDGLAPAVLSVVSRKVHGAAGTFDLPLPLTGTPQVECRTGMAGGNHRIVVTFNLPVTVGSISVMSRDGQASAMQSTDGAVVTIDLAAVANAQILAVTLVNVRDGNTGGNIVIPMGVLLGDTTGDGFVNSGDVIQVRSRSGQAPGPATFRSDFNLDGSVNSGDSITARSRSGTSLP